MSGEQGHLRTNRWNILDTHEAGSGMSYSPMTESEVHAFLAAEPARTAKVASTRKDGRPHLAPVWFALDEDGSILFNTGSDTVKGKTLLRDPRVAICVD